MKKLVLTHEEQTHIVEHYQNMIDYALEHSLDEYNRAYDMSVLIGDVPNIDYCILCQTYECSVCPLTRIDMKCGGWYSWYDKMIESETYGEFANKAQAFLDIVKKAEIL